MDETQTQTQTGAETKSPTDGAVPAAEAPKLFTQEDLDRHAAQARKAGREAALKKAKEEQAEAEERMFQRLSALIAGKAPTAAQAEVKPQAEVKVEGGVLGATLVQAGPDPEFLAVKTEVTELRRALEEKTKTEKAAAARERKRQVREMTVAAVKKTGISDSLVEDVADLLDMRGNIKATDKGVFFVSVNPYDAEDVTSHPLEHGIVNVWGKTSAADKYRPAIPTGGGTSASSASPFAQRSPGAPMTQSEKWAKARADQDAMKAAQRK